MIPLHRDHSGAGRLRREQSRRQRREGRALAKRLLVRLVVGGGPHA